MRARTFVYMAVLTASLITMCCLCAAQLQTSGTSVPPLVKYSGTVKAKPSGVVGITFALYREQSGGAPLWLETQNVQVGENGRFTVTLGAGHADGVPTDVFATGEARWLGIQPEGEVEQTRVLLVSVPYALKASDADTLGGKPLSAFVLADTQAARSFAAAPLALRTVGTTLTPMADSVGVTSGAANFLPKFADATNLTNSKIIDSAGNIGIGTSAPESILDVGLTSAQNVRFGTWPWSLRFGALQSGTQFIGISVKKKAADNNYVASSQNIAGVNHTIMEFHYDGSFRIKQQSHQVDGTILNPTTSFSIVGNGNVGVGVDKATQKLEVVGNLKITGTGNGLMLPDGTVLKTAALPPSIAGVTAGTGLTGGGTAGSPTVALDTNFTDSRYLRTDTAIVSSVKTGIGLTDAGTSTSPTLALDTAFTDARYMRTGTAVVSGVTVGPGIAATGTAANPVLALDTSFTDTRYVSTVKAGSGLSLGGTSGSPTLALDTTFTDGRYMRTGSAVVSGVTVGAGIAASGTPANPVLALDTLFTDTRYLRAGGPNVFTGDQAINGGLSVNGALTSGPQVVNGDLVSSGTLSGSGVAATAIATKTLQARLGIDGGDADAVLVSVDSDTATGVDITSTTTTGTATGIHSTVNSPYAFAGVFDNIAGGSILLGRIKVGDYWVKKFRVDGNGRVYANNGYSTGGADFAESFAVAGEKSEYQPGDVLVIDTSAVRRLARSQQTYSTLVAGVYSTRPGVLASPYDMDDPNLNKEVPLAVVGVVPCKVTTENGPIAAGDLLVTSSVAGHAMKGTDRSRMIGAVVGKALQSLSEGTGVIEILVSLQ